MIMVRLMGGLGNQMFQYAAGRRLAQHRNTVLKLDLTFLEGAHNSLSPRLYELEHLNITAEIASPSERVAFAGESKSLRQLLLKRARNFFGLSASPARVLVEQDFHFNTAVLNAPDNTLLDGYWQSEKYFADIAAIIRREFTVTSEPDDWNRRLSEIIEGCESVAIHVRRGDYVNNPVTNAYHGVCSPDYYRSAVDMVVSRVDEVHFFIFSDDPAWARENLEIHWPATYMDHNGPNHGYEDLRLMRLCRHHIIANSSFSWWGAWLARTSGNIVIAPDRWFSNADIDTRDLMPDGWITIPRF